jgi:hypothetical protein
MSWTVTYFTAKVCVLATEALGHPLHAPGEKSEKPR